MLNYQDWWYCLKSIVNFPLISLSLNFTLPSSISKPNFQIYITLCIIHPDLNKELLAFKLQEKIWKKAWKYDFTVKYVTWLWKIEIRNTGCPSSPSAWLNTMILSEEWLNTGIIAAAFQYLAWWAVWGQAHCGCRAQSWGDSWCIV